MHKVVIRAKGGNGGTTTVSCDCRAVMGAHTRTKGGGEFFEPMPIKQGETIWDAYNNPDNHNEEFTYKDRINL